MPFGQSVKVGEPARDPKELANFRNVYEKLLKPAIEQAGCSPIRADSETSAGDIRTDMFFELVTADLVVADISILNPNVYYELGVRHGVCPRGVLVVNARWTTVPFDVASDRSYSYDATLFTTNAPQIDAEAKQKRLMGSLMHYRRPPAAYLAG